MQVIIQNLPQFHPKSSKTQTFPVFSCNLGPFFENICCPDDQSTQKRTNWLCSMLFGRDIYLLQKYLKNDPDELDMKKFNLNFSYAKFSNFLRRFYRWKNEHVQQRTNALSSRLFEGQLQFHVRKEPQIDTKIAKKIGSCLTIQ